MLCQVLLTPITIVLTVIIPALREIATTVCGWVSSVITVVKTVVEKVCEWLPWPLDELCKLVSKVIEVVETVWNWVCNTVINFVIELITILVSLIIYVVRVICIIVSMIVGLLPFLLCLMGLTLPKRVRICIKVITDASGNSQVTAAAIEASIATMRKVYGECDFRVEVDGVERIAEPSLLTSTDDSFWSLFSGWHAWFSQHACGCCNQLTVFFVDKIQGSSDGFTWWGDNWCRVDATANTDPTIMAHEVGHLLSLWHVSDNNNLMFPNSGPPENPRNKLTSFQCCWMRTSPFASVGGALR